MPRLLQLLMVLSLSSCTFATLPSPPTSFDVNTFSRFAADTVLCFDLRRDLPIPEGGLILRIAGSDQQHHRQTLALPFSSSSVAPNRAFLTTAASYDGFTLINFSVGVSSSGPDVVTFSPVLAPTVDKTPQMDRL